MASFAHAPAEDARRRPTDEFTSPTAHVQATVTAREHDSNLPPSHYAELYLQRHSLERVSLLDRIARFWPTTSLSLTGVIRAPPLPSFQCSQFQPTAMEESKQYQIPHTPRVISPSPTPSEASAKDGYFGPTTRSAARRQRLQSPPAIDEDSSGSDPEKRARARSRSPIFEGRRRRMSGLTAKRQLNGKAKSGDLKLSNGAVNGHLSPQAANKNYWRELSRSPSPLGLIPIHQKWRSFVSSPWNDN